VCVHMVIFSNFCILLIVSIEERGMAGVVDMHCLTCQHIRMHFVRVYVSIDVHV
jgi:hypothetical protein